jgi:hypothetical protein
MKQNKCVSIVCGMERNGTTYIGGLINSHSNIFSGFECGILLDNLTSFNREPFVKWLSHGGWNFGLPKNYTDDIKKLNYNNIYDYIYEHKGTTHGKDNLESMLITKSKYFIDKCPAYIYELQDVYNKIKNTQIPIIVVLKNFDHNHHSCCVKRKENITNFIDKIKKTINSLNFISQLNPENIFVFSYDYFMIDETKGIRMLENIIYRFNPELVYEALTLQNFIKKIESKDYPYKNWYKDESQIIENNNYPQIKKTYNELLMKLSINKIE